MRAWLARLISLGALSTGIGASGCASVIGADFGGFEDEAAADGADAEPERDAAHANATDANSVDAKATDGHDALPAIVDSSAGEAIDPCEAAGACQPGLVDSTDCEKDKVRQRTCGSSCQWGPYGLCARPPHD